MVNVLVVQDDVVPLAEGTGASLLVLNAGEGGEVGEHHHRLGEEQEEDEPSDEGGGESGDAPEDVDPGFEVGEERGLFVVDNVEGGNAGFPHLHNCDRHIKGKQVERSLISVANTALGPNTMMVQFEDTSSTSAAMRNPWGFIVITVLTLPLKIIAIRVFLRISIGFSFQLSWFVGDRNSLIVTPEAHRNDEPCELGFHCLFVVVFDERIEMLG